MLKMSRSTSPFSESSDTPEIPDIDMESKVDQEINEGRYLFGGKYWPTQQAMARDLKAQAMTVVNFNMLRKVVGIRDESKESSIGSGGYNYDEYKIVKTDQGIAFKDPRGILIR